MILNLTEMFFGADLWLFHLVNGWSGFWLLDWIARFAQGNDLAKGGLFMAAYWWSWFADRSNNGTRKKIILSLLGAIASLVVARALASALPFRVRPLYTAGIGFHQPVLPPSGSEIDIEDWSSFPSDHAAFFFALAFGLWQCNRLVGIAAMAFTLVWVAVVRVYLGIHYPSDVLAGAAIGVTCSYAAFKIPSNWIVTKVLAFEQRSAPAFYAMMFLITFEVASLFNDIRAFMHASLRVLQTLGFHSVGLAGALAAGVGWLVLIGVMVGLAVRGFHRDA